jgi:glucarate dehydratase
VAHESAWNFRETLNVVKAGAADIICVEPRMSWGVTGCKKAAIVAEAAGLPVAIHSCAELGVAQACFAQVAVTLPNLTASSQQMYDWFADDYIKERVRLENGTIYPPDGPGLGVEIDRDKVAQFNENYKRSGGYSISAVDPKNLALTPTPTWPSY